EIEFITFSDSLQVSGLPTNIPDSVQTAFSWPDWEVALERISLVNNKVVYQVEDEVPVSGQFNPEVLFLDQLSLEGDDIYLKDQSTRGYLTRLRFHEASGINIDRFELDWVIDDQNLQISEIDIEALGSEISGELSAKYTSLQAMIDQPEHVVVNLNLPHIQVAIEKLHQFQPDLATNPYLQTLSEKPISGYISANGPVRALNVLKAGIEWGPGTSVSATGQLYNATNLQALRFDFPNVVIRSSREDLNLFVPEDSVGIRYPDASMITAELSGTMEDIATRASLESDLGRVSFEGDMRFLDTIVFQASLTTTELMLDSLLQNPGMGQISLSLSGAGRGIDPYTMDATLQAVIDSFSWDPYPIKNLVLDGNLKNGLGKFTSSYEDENLDFNLDGNLLLDSLLPQIDATLDVVNADLAALSLTEKEIKMAFQMDAWFQGNDTAFNTKVDFPDGSVFFEDKTYPLGKIDFTAHVTPDTTAGSLSSRMMDMELESNTSPGGFVQAFTRHIQSYISDSTVVVDSTGPPVRVFMHASVRKDPLMSEVFLTGLEEMDSIRFDLDFEESQKNLTAFLTAPRIVYSGVEIDSVALDVSSDPDHFNLDLGLRKITAGPVTIHRTKFTNEILDNVLYSHFLATYDDENLIEFKTETSQYEDSLRIHLDPSILIFDALVWDIPASNQILIGENKIEFQSMRISRGNQFISFEDNPGDNDLVVNIQRFNLSNVISYLNPDTLLASGNINGQITLEEPLGNAGLIADVRIDSLQVLQVDLGTMDLYGETEDARNYSADLLLKGGEIDLTAEGEYHATDDQTQVMLDLQIDSIKMNAVETFSMGTIEKTTGYLAGSIQAEGLLSDLRYGGRLHFYDARLTPSQLQAPFSLGEQRINFDNEGIHLNQFTITDSDGNTLVVDGEIETTDLFNPRFDLSIEAQNFQILNASEEDNEVYYGNAIFDAEATLTGNLSLPRLNIQLEVGEETDVTYVMPQGQAQIQSRDGIVTFVNKSEPDLLTSENENDRFVIQGYIINALINVHEEASFQVIISEETGDHFNIMGSGDLVLRIDEQGRMSLTGIYTLEDGHYEMNLYNLVNRRFDIAKGSTVSWSGDPFDANIDVRAIYRIETSPASLMASATSGVDQSIQNQYQRKLPFLVYLNVEGSLSEPRLTFDIDMPEESRGDAGGQVYGRIQQINQEEQLVNKQVFALLVLNRFYPASGSDGSAGGIVSVARDNLNQALSDQLNIFSERLLGDTGFELNFGLDSYTDYGGNNPQNRTELDIAARKSFLNERLIVHVGSQIDIEGGNSNPQENNPIIGNVNVEYLITPNGQLRIRGFRKNVYENVIDGQTIVSGLALIFTKEFNKFHELWMPMVSEEQKDKKSEGDQSE
ncbi:MAG TPA: translocation/assembly module TamB domain-containing protein, partial [Membranihabitans sp.]|nr:translocation/assembly module TamB domain-containing protein [Membranihabitans sp.]